MPTTEQVWAALQPWVTGGAVVVAAIVGLTIALGFAGIIYMTWTRIFLVDLAEMVRWKWVQRACNHFNGYHFHDF